MKLADKITNHLFTNGAGHKAKRLVFEMEDGSNGGGWGREPARTAIQHEIEEMENSFHRLCSSILGGASDDVIERYARAGIELLKGNDQ